MDLNTLALEINEINIQNGWNILQPQEWNNEHKVPAILALIHSQPPHP